MRRHALKIAIVSAVALFALGAGPAGQTQSTADLGLVGRIAHVYHGIAVDGQRREIPLARADVEASIDRIIAVHGPGARSGSLATLDKAIALAQEDKQTDADLLLALKGAKADQLLALRAKSVDPMLASRLAFLREWFKGQGDRNTPARLNTAFSRLASAAKLKKFNLDISIISSWTIGDYLAAWKGRYAARCRIAKVPVPPNWGDAAWVQKTDGTTTTVPYSSLYIINTSNYSTEVWTYGDTTTDGGCIALPRTNTTTGDITMGVICQRASTGKACFYDNRPHEGGDTFTAAELAGTKADIARDWVNGYDSALSGGGVCTDCHRGENAYVLHQDTLLSNNPSMPFDTAAASWYTMINSLGWTNPAKTTFATGGGCTSCHEIGSTTDSRNSSYCSILEAAARAEMPSTSSPVGWSPSSSSPYKAHIDEIKVNC